MTMLSISLKMLAQDFLSTYPPDKSLSSLFCLIAFNRFCCNDTLSPALPRRSSFSVHNRITAGTASLH